MIRESELIAQMTYLEHQVLVMWIDDGVITPHRDEQGYLFDQIDEARIALCCDLHYRMGLEHASLPVILSLVDQLHDVRHHLRAMAQAVANQSDAVQQAITRHMEEARTPFSDGE